MSGGHGIETERAAGRGSPLAKGQTIYMTVGIVFAQGWVPLVSQIVSLYRSGSFASGKLIVLLAPFFLFFALVLFMCAVFGRSVADPRGSSLIGALCVLFACSVYVLFDEGLPEWRTAYLTILTGVLLGIGSGLLVFSWSRVLELVEGRRVILIASVLGACMLACMPQIVMSPAVSLSLSLAVTAIGSTASLICIFLTMRKTPFRGSEVKADDESSLQGRALPVSLTKLAGSVFLVAFCLGCMLIGFLCSDLGTALSYSWVFGLAGTLLAIGVVAIDLKVIGNEQPGCAAFRFSAIVIIIALFPTGWETAEALIYVICALTLAVWFYLVAALLSFAEVAKSGLGSVSLVYCLGIASMSVGAMAGAVLGLASSSLPVGAYVRTVIAMALVYGATNMLFPFMKNGAAVSKQAIDDAQVAGGSGTPDSLSGDAESQGIHEETVPQALGSGASSTLSVDYDTLAAEYGLTAREREALEVLAQGYGLSRVQEALVVSEGTAITHRRHIYQKLDVHSREELIDLVAGFKTRQGEGKGEGDDR